MQPVPFQRHMFPPDVIRLAGWLCFRFTLSFRDVEEMLAQRGIEASYETVRCRALKFGQAFARNLRRSRPKQTGRWHLDEMVVKSRGMWRRRSRSRTPRGCSDRSLLNAEGRMRRDVRARRSKVACPWGAGENQRGASPMSEAVRLLALQA